MFQRWTFRKILCLKSFCSVYVVAEAFILNLLSGLQIVFTHDEVSFIQNLVFYIEEAYRTPVSSPLCSKILVCKHQVELCAET